MGYLLILRLVGKKKGDFTEKAILNSYKCMTENFYPSNKVILKGLKNIFRYSGPREAVFHALIRKNMGCTHFIIGRDHAGVGDYYGRYEAQELAATLDSQYGLGIKLLMFKEPYYCNKCGQVVTAQHCKHDKKDIIKISGTSIRKDLREGRFPNSIFMRQEISKILINLKGELFVPGGDE